MKILNSFGTNFRVPESRATESLSPEVRDSLDILQGELDEAHLLDDYKADDGKLYV